MSAWVDQESDVTGGGIATVERPTTGDGDGTGQGDWFALKGKPWRCSCGASSPYMAHDLHPHKVIVWPSEDDPNLLKLKADILREDGEPTEVIPYERSMGEAISFYKITPS